MKRTLLFLVLCFIIARVASIAGRDSQRDDR